MHYIMLLFLVFLIFLLLSCMLVRRAAQRAAFDPEWILSKTPAYHNIKFEDVIFRTRSRRKLHGWYLKNSEAKSTILFLHGNTGNISSYADEVCMLYKNLKSNIFIIDYRGYGKSQGHPQMRGLYRDALAAYAYLIKKKKADPKKLICFGHSMGGAIAAYLATRRKIQALIITSAFSSIGDIISILFPRWLASILKILNPVRFPTLQYIKKIHCPVLLMHGAEDAIVPSTLGKKVYDAVSTPKLWYNIPNAGHNQIFLQGGSKYWYLVKSFIHKTINDEALQELS